MPKHIITEDGSCITTKMSGFVFPYWLVNATNRWRYIRQDMDGYTGDDSRYYRRLALSGEPCGVWSAVQIYRALVWGLNLHIYCTGGCGPRTLLSFLLLDHDIEVCQWSNCNTILSTVGRPIASTIQPQWYIYLPWVVYLLAIDLPTVLFILHSHIRLLWHLLSQISCIGCCLRTT